MNSNETLHNNEQIKLQFYPENLEVSKICSVLNEDLSFKIEDVYSLKEIQKLVSSKEALIEVLNSLAKEEVVKLKVSEGEGTILIKDELVVYSFLNVPNKINKEQLLEILGIKSEEVKRIYKQSLYWIMVSENPEFNSAAEQKMKQVKFEESPLRYDAAPGKNIKKQVMKKIQHITYIKETDELKASSGSNTLSAPRKDSFSKGEKASHSTNVGSNSEPFSWRKKSDVSATSKEESHSGKNSFHNTTNKVVSSFNPGNSKFARRERFNSDPHDKSAVTTKETHVFTSQYDSNNAEKSYPEVVIDPKQVMYPLIVTYKYSMKEVYEYYNKIKDSITGLNVFKTSIPEVCNEKIKDVSSSFVYGLRKNSFEAKSGINKSNFEVKTSVLNQEKIVIPKNNPLGDINLNINK